MADLDSTKIYGDLDVSGVIKTSNWLELSGTSGSSKVSVSSTGQTIELVSGSNHILGVNSSEGPYYKPTFSTVHNIYHEGNSPKSDAVNVSSSMGLATSKAVKTAYDKAVAAQSASVPTSRAISASNGLSGGGNLTANRTISGVNATTSVKGVVQLNSTLTSTSTSLAATASTVKTLNDNKEPNLAADRKRKITISGATPSGGVDGDIWIQYK